MKSLFSCVKHVLGMIPTSFIWQKSITLLLSSSVQKISHFEQKGFYSINTRWWVKSYKIYRDCQVFIYFAINYVTLHVLIFFVNLLSYKNVYKFHFCVFQMSIIEVRWSCMCLLSSLYLFFLKVYVDITLCWTKEYNYLILSLIISAIFTLFSVLINS